MTAISSQRSEAVECTRSDRLVTQPGFGQVDVAERADDWLEAEPLQHQRAENHREREEENQVAIREGRAGIDYERHGERGRERIDAAHAGPADEQHVTPR